MAQTSDYCKAYPVADLRRFPGWDERVPPASVAAGDDAAAGDEAACFYLHDDLVVTAGIYRDERVAFDRVDDAWKAFCRDVLKFAAPDRPVARP
jgi:hypothetical protein